MPRAIHCQHFLEVRYGDLAVDWPWLRAALVQGAGRVRVLAVAWDAVSAPLTQVLGESPHALEGATAPA